MTDREQYTPSPASVAQVRKDGEKWTLIVVKELRHPPQKVWQALTDPAQLREWAPFDADGSLGTVGTKVKLTTVGAPALHVTETTVTRADAPEVLEYNWGGFDMRWQLEAMGGGTRPPLHRDGCCRVAHLLRRAGSPARRSPPRPHGWSRRDEVRRLAATARGVCKAVRR